MRKLWQSFVWVCDSNERRRRDRWQERKDLDLAPLVMSKHRLSDRLTDFFFKQICSFDRSRQIVILTGHTTTFCKKGEIARLCLFGVTSRALWGQLSNCPKTSLPMCESLLLWHLPVSVIVWDREKKTDRTNELKRKKKVHRKILQVPCKNSSFLVHAYLAVCPFAATYHSYLWMWCTHKLSKF